MEKKIRDAITSPQNMKRSVCDSDVSKNRMYEFPPPELGEERFPCPVTKNMRNLEEFKGLYEGRLRRLEFETGGEGREEILRMKVRILDSYVNDLSDQNQVLIQTVEDLEKEANGKVAFLRAKIHNFDQKFDDLGYEKKSLEERNESLHSQILDMKLDISALVKLVQRTQRTHGLDSPAVFL